MSLFGDCGCQLAARGETLGATTAESVLSQIGKSAEGVIRSIGQTKEDAASGVIKTGTLGAVGVVGSVVAGLIVYKLLFGGRK